MPELSLLAPRSEKQRAAREKNGLQMLDLQVH